ncbi:MAG: ATP-dependent DNA helicase RecG [Clostridiaceae bacterium]|jgi:ATP-dependent DNA helicase RecG|nr:ATP-dependent DNA helicase RecG [Clostridiaceae bacterium]
MPQEDIFGMSIKYVKGVGEARARLLSKLGIYSVNDVLNFFPRDYQDRSVLKKITELADGEECGVRASLVSNVTESRPRRNLSIIKALVSDGTAFLSLTWFNQSYIKNNLKNGVEYIFFGKVKRSGMRLEMNNPVIETAEQFGKNTGRILPVYSLTKGLTQTHLRKITENALKLTGERFEETLPQDLRESYNLSQIRYSYEEIHFPQSFQHMVQARRRLVFEELLILQLGLLKSKGISLEQKGNKLKPVDISPLLNKLSFKLTSAQKRVFEEICNDMQSEKKMNRLIQGDVGSGKTIVAVLAIYLAAKNKYQSAFMAPTEILAEQHYRSISPLFGELGVSVRLLTGSTKKKEKEEIKALTKEGKIDVLIGTHAILEDDTEFFKLGLVITDEQHRFGVRQRAKLSVKGENPDLLVMTATPIPRTLTLALYGDLDVSIIDELPPDRKPIDTYAVNESYRDRIYNFIRKNVADGRQAYIVCPLVEDSDEIEAESAEGLAERLKNNELKDLRVGLIHGKMKSSEKEKVMRAFVKGQLDVLVSTTVIEVGVNVPNATLMVIENAERFGLSQLHQLRGRVGRGKYKSYCILINQSKSDVSRKRMEIMTSTNDGFVISEKDLELRGPGDVFGVRQHGLPELKIANLYRDIDILNDVQKAVKQIIDYNLLSDDQYRPLVKKLDDIMKEKFKEISLN